MNAYDLPNTVGPWYLTDSDCAQYCRKLSATCYEFTQINWLDVLGDTDEEYIVSHDVIELADCSIENLEGMISGFYLNLVDMADSYGKDLSLEDFLQLIAECAFENEPGVNNTSDIMTWNDCVKLQYKYMKAHNKEKN